MTRFRFELLIRVGPHRLEVIAGGLDEHDLGAVAADLLCLAAQAATGYTDIITEIDAESLARSSAWPRSGVIFRASRYTARVPKDQDAESRAP
jgi:hypothetical protein